MSLLAPSPPLQVAAGSFFRCECDHVQLFHTEYKRSNRTKGLKILRCFPHCCPEHIDRSYCGSSLSVSVRLAERPVGSATPEPSPSEVLSVFARFEAVSDVSLRTGECVEVDKIQQGVQTETNLDGQWIAGALDRPSVMVASICPPDATSEQDRCLIFHLNGKTFSRWYYDWESGANKAQRLMKHVLKAYVVERVAVDMDDNFTTISSREAFTQLYRVMHVVTSPEFTVISYRRAPLEGGSVATPQFPQKVRGDLPRSRFINDRRDVVYTPSLTRSASVVPIGRDRGVTRWTPRESNRRMELYEVEAKRRRRVATKFDGEVVHPLEDKLFWEHANAKSVAVSKNLALLFAFLRWAPLGFYAPFVDELVNLVQQKLLEPISTGSFKSEKMNCFAQLLVDRARSEEEGRTGAATHEFETLLRVGSHAALWLYSRETRRWLRTFFRQYAACVLNKKDLRACFLQFLHELEEHLNTEVFAATTLGNLDNVAEEVIAAVYSCDYFRGRRPFVRQILSGQGFAGWNMFVAQMRDSFISSTSLPQGLCGSERNATFATAHPPHNAIERSWNGEWLLDMEESSWDIGEVSPSESKNGRDVSFFSIVELISQIVHIEVAIDIQVRSLRIRSMRGLAGRLDCMHVVLDGKDRVFRLFPNGIASSAGEGSCGDYVGRMRVEKPGRLLVFLETFVWAMEEVDQSFHVRARIEYQEGNRLSIDGDILATAASFTAEEMPYVGEMSLRTKLKSVGKANARRYLASGVSKDGLAAAWREHSKFHLSYRKLD
ncbi:hypothetical protein PF005_g20339 [Phytophthora fragariae]|uniref:Uncharacterized protein n=1 Tax=Phytophthora fragariae TaxID=53985 RepID=A0A6A3XEJ6_9STRA|nr:hypothetical protein PF003_g3275 [Phytophthora fragariae]KAE8928482.1 hypothetical protein PF009_g21375 [Phytophthora fragariae]KAE9087308.1 hypothetical protein PF007_g20424 [Phytophthora fragariae]KAE9115333.1 hypothetical protein PF006_g19314 [Phytophthora fragariae]KAE9187726.1 hypothetical protein PF005_g20339 [Phytophthora fragariae]